ncbi:uncharacterized protein LOC110729931 [Chenopodium quinoa]|uniref:uncharacterized protein LOC110729931 n=1 Tax=Chenopodium quinoa TaxID=63459 RepID=UPI000B77644A|nr:uncharacterized protein LOC110729931 [Chenopodium quinoa]
MLCARLKEELPGLISENQGLFVSGRSIIDNILIFQDMLKEYNCKGRPPRCTIKVDLRKAYDSISWDFIAEMLRALNFPEVFIGWVMQCVMTPSFSLILNGGLHGYFKGKIDDLMLFAYGNKKYISLLIQALKAFEHCSGLQANSKKTDVYFGCVPKTIQQGILEFSWFVQDSLLEQQASLLYYKRFVGEFNSYEPAHILGLGSAHLM